MLSCGHTVCLACLVRLLSENKDGKLLKCPFEATHKPTDLPDTLSSDKISTIIPAFPRNHTIAYPLQTPEGLKPKCSRKECGPASPAISFCVHCKKDLCAACAEYHSIFCPGHTTVPVNKYVPSQKEVDDRSTKDSARKASYEKSVKDAEAAKKREEDEEARKEAAEIEAINSKKVNAEEIIRAIKNEYDRKNVNNNNNVSEKGKGASPAPTPAAAPKESVPERPIGQRKSPQSPAIPTPDDGPKPAMPRRPAATVRSAASSAGSGDHPAQPPRAAATVRGPAQQPRSGTESPLPEGWTELVDKKSGKKYYYNKTTKKTSWHKPTESVSPSGSTGITSPAPEEEPAAEALPEGWTELVDKKSGKKYYYNKITKKTSWHKPEN